MMDIGLAFDKGYLSPFYVLLASLFRHNPAAEIKLHVIATGLTEIEQKELSTYVAREGSAIAFYEITETDVSQFVMPDHEVTYLSHAIYYRLFFPFLLPSITRLLYMDVDTLVVGNLASLFATKLDNKPVGAVTDTDMPVRYELGIDKAEDYFNSGVLLIAISNWKEQGITEHALQIIREQPQLIKQYPDQDALNMALKDNWYRLPTGYNLMRRYVPDTIPKRDFKTFLHQQFIIHYNGKKPWFSDCEHRLRGIYKQYAQHSLRPAAGAITQVKLPKDKRQQLRRSRLIEFYFDYPELVNLWRRLKRLKG